MKINKIELKNFRNYEELSLSLGEKTNFLFGNNGQGKTNLLEAIYLCTCARSHRTSKDNDLKKKDSDFYEVSLFFEKQAQYEESLKIRVDSKRTIYHDFMKLEKIADMMGIFQSVIFAPEDIALVKEGPSERRRFMDLVLSQSYPLYFSYLLKASRLLEQRNALLKQLYEKYKEKSFFLSREQKEREYVSLSVWDEQYAKVWVQVFLARYFLVKDLKKFALLAYDKISNGKEKISIFYEACKRKDLSEHISLEGLDKIFEENEHLTLIQKIEKVPLEEKEKLFQFYLSKLETSFLEDVKKKVSSYGFHKDDLVFYINGENIKVFASQGQTRSVVLSIKLAELQFLAKENKKRPVLLLDDVLSELDENRRKALISFIHDEQVILTCTDAKESMLFLQETKNLKESKFFYVEEAKVKEISFEEIDSYA